MSDLRWSDLGDIATFGPHGKTPDKNTDAEGWNAVSDPQTPVPVSFLSTRFHKTWNRYLEWKFHPNSPSDIDHTRKRIVPFFEMCENPVIKQGYFEQSTELSTALLKLQLSIADMIGHGRLWSTFVSGWLNLDSKHRLRHILRALVQLCDSVDLEESRLLCPESTNSFLERDSGRGFLDLVTTLSLPPQSNSNIQAKRDGPTLIFNAQFDRVMGFDQSCPVGGDPVLWDLVRNDRQHARSEFLCRMIFNIVLVACGEEVPSRPVHKVGGGRKELRKFFSRLPDSVRSMHGFKEGVIDPLKARQKTAVWACTACGRSEVDLPRGTSIVFCVRCHALERRVPYCNKWVELIRTPSFTDAETEPNIV